MAGLNDRSEIEAGGKTDRTLRRTLLIGRLGESRRLDKRLGKLRDGFNKSSKMIEKDFAILF